MAVPPWDSHTYWVARFLLRRGLGLVYLLGFLVAATQFRALAGEGGLTPVSRYLERTDRFRDRPSLFYLFPTDRAMAVAAWAGVGLSALAVTGLADAFGTPLSMAVWAALWALYLSFVNAGQTFYGFGWESMLLEAGFLAVFLGGSAVAAPVAVVWLFRWLLFRDVFGAGLIKIRGDECWRDLTCMEYHYETQPMPNPVSWYAHHMPRWSHRGAVLVNHAVELLVPFAYFAPQPVAAGAGVVTVLFMGWLLLTGNFAWLNLLTLVFAFATLPDSLFSALPATPPAVAPTPAYLQVASWLLAGVVLLLSVRPASNMLSERQVMNTSFDPLHLVNTYGAFGSITRERHEVVLQGTDEERVTSDTEWETYTFPGKPTDPERRPPQVAPYHHRLDWQLWFAAMSTPRHNPWFVRFCARLLEGDAGAEGLLREDPFPDGSPEHVRALRYRYEFTTPEERAATGRWWSRERVGTYLRPVSEGDPVLERYRR